MKYNINSLSDINTVAKKIKHTFGSKLCLFLTGDLGAGKTTLVQSLAKAYGYKDSVVSPTFSLMNIYENEHVHMVHLDLYRLNSTKELLYLGLDYLPEHILCVEWPKFTEYLPSPTLAIKLHHNNHKRVLEVISASKSFTL